MSTGNLNLKLWNAARDGDKDAVVAAISAGADKNWKNDSEVSDNDIKLLMIIMIVVWILDHMTHHIIYIVNS